MAGMVFAVTEIWKAFIEKRDQCGNIATSMKEAKQKISTKIRANKGITVKATVTKTKRTKAEKLSKVVIKTASGKTKKSMISLKSETNNKLSGDDFLCKSTQSTELKCKNPAEDLSVNKIDTMAEVIFESGQSPDSQETISDNSLLQEKDKPDELQTSKGCSENSDFLDSKCYLESSESDCSDSDYIST